MLVSNAKLELRLFPSVFLGRMPGITGVRSVNCVTIESEALFRGTEDKDSRARQLNSTSSRPFRFGRKAHIVACLRLLALDGNDGKTRQASLLSVKKTDDVALSNS
jgi:hypothetical protein